MKKILIALTVSASIFLIAYLSGAFYTCAFNITAWTSEQRGYVLGFGLFFGLGLGGLVFEILNELDF